MLIVKCSFGECFMTLRDRFSFVTDYSSKEPLITVPMMMNDDRVRYICPDKIDQTWSEFEPVAPYYVGRALCYCAIQPS